MVTGAAVAVDSEAATLPSDPRPFLDNAVSAATPGEAATSSAAGSAMLMESTMLRPARTAGRRSGNPKGAVEKAAAEAIAPRNTRVLRMVVFGV